MLGAESEPRLNWWQEQGGNLCVSAQIRNSGAGEGSQAVLGVPGKLPVE